MFMRELSRLEELQSSYSDTYKDVFGIRPSGLSDACWLNEAWLEAELDHLCEMLKLELASEALREAEAVKQFEAKISDIIQAGAENRETAIRWLMDAEAVYGDTEYFCFLNGLPYGYFK